MRLGVLTGVCVIALVCCIAQAAEPKPIQHDAEHYVLLHQYAEKWAAEDTEMNERLTHNSTAVSYRRSAHLTRFG